VQSHAPYIDGNLYWDCGSTDGTHRISTSYTKSTNPEALVFVAGSTKGREVWRNGAKIAGNTGINGTFTAASVADVSVLGAASGSGLGSDSETVYLFGVVARAWSDGEILQWTANPYGMFQSPRKWWLPAVPARWCSSAPSALFGAGYAHPAQAHPAGQPLAQRDPGRFNVRYGIPREPTMSTAKHTSHWTGSGRNRKPLNAIPDASVCVR
jgi:hypothetical protein